MKARATYPGMRFTAHSIARCCGNGSPLCLPGPVANFLFAIVAYALMFMVGVSGLKAIVGDVQPDTMAALAGFEAGEQIVVSE